MVNIIISSDPRYCINRGAVQAAVLNVLSQNKITGRVEIEVNIVGDRKMHELNRKYRGQDSTTDVLSFVLEDLNPNNLQYILPAGRQIPRVGFIAAPDKVLRLGSIVISHPQAVEDAALDGIAVEEEISFLVEHGTKHLLGNHHD